MHLVHDCAHMTCTLTRVLKIFSTELFHDFYLLWCCCGLLQVWSAGILAFPYIDLPFTRFGKAMKARQQLLAMLQVSTVLVQVT